MGMANVLVFFNWTLIEPVSLLSILKAFLLPNSNVLGEYVTLSQTVHTKLVLWENILSFHDNRVQKLLTRALEYLPLLLIIKGLYDSSTQKESFLRLNFIWWSKMIYVFQILKKRE